jgi:beta-N-acetylglucosaminidase
MTNRKRRCTLRNVAFIMAISATIILLASIVNLGGQGLFLVAHAAGTAPYSVDIANTNGTYTTQISVQTYAEAYAAFTQNSSPNAVIRDATTKVLAMKRGMVVTRPVAPDVLVLFDNKFPSGYSPYVTSNIVTFYNSTSADGTKVTFPVFGFIGTCSVDKVWLIPGAFIYDPAGAFGGTTTSTKWKFDSYTKDSEGNLIHTLRRYSDANQNTEYASITVDKAPAFMTTNVPYYSSDSLHYYTNPYDAAANNVSAPSYAGLHAIYYQLVSYRTKTSYTATQLDSYMAVIGKTNSVYYGKANDFITYQNIYGVNAAMEMAFANLESGYGTSTYAVQRNNLFGINAVDSDPNQADYFTSVAACIEYHMSTVLSRAYFDAYAYINTSLPPSFYDVSGDTRDGTWYTGGSYTGDSKYFGAIMGNKKSGVNVRYASDPSHGEKIAGIMYGIDQRLGMKDYDRYSIGITNKATYVYSLPNDTSNKLYKIASQSANHTSDYPVGMAVTILGVSGDYYQIISDMPLKAYTDGTTYACNVWTYDHAVSIAYVRKDCITLVRNNLPDGSATVTSPTYTIDNTSKYITKIPTNTTVANFKASFANGTVRVYNGGVEATSGAMKTGMRIEAYDVGGNLLTVYTTVVTGDVNGDGSVSISDLVQINRHLLGLQTITGASWKASDTNNSATVTISDLVKINRVLLGLDAITPY